MTDAVIFSADCHRDAFFEKSKAELKHSICEATFFHDMVLEDGLRTGSWVYDERRLPPNYHLYPLFNYLKDIELKNARCIDIGTFDGMTAFVLAELGAYEVVATCQHDLTRFRQVRAYQGYANIDYRPNTSLANFPAIFKSASFDVAIISAMLHHLTSPLDALLESRRLLRHGGLLVIESIAIDHDAPALFLNTEIEEPIFGAPTLFAPTFAALRGMLRLASFEILSETILLGGREARETNFERVTFLARAVKPSQITGRSAKTAEIHLKSPKIGGVDFRDWENDKSGSALAAYSGVVGSQTLNIWMNECTAPLSPPRRDCPLAETTRFSVGLEKEFLALARKYPGDAFSWKDVYLLGVRYPAETMPDGMTWGLKQFGNLHVLDFVRRLGLVEVLEVGPGFNMFFPNHLPKWCRYTGLDAPGFYDSGVLELANAQRAHVRMANGMLGAAKNELAAAAFDACVSVSVLEHVPAADRDSVCADMFRVLKPGGWAVHSIDLSMSSIHRVFSEWLSAFTKVGFVIDPTRIFSPDAELSRGGSSIMYEPLSIRARFHGSYRETIWTDKIPIPDAGQCATLLVAAQKPHSSDLLRGQIA